MVISYSRRITDLQKLSLLANLENQNELIVNLPKDCITNFNDVIGTLLPQGTILYHNGIKYLTIQPITPLASQTPDSIGMLAHYKPYRDGQEYEWLYGEYVEIGWVRYVTDEDGNVTRYRAVQDPNANIYSPELVPGIWQAQ